MEGLEEEGVVGVFLLKHTGDIALIRDDVLGVILLLLSTDVIFFLAGVEVQVVNKEGEGGK